MNISNVLKKASWDTIQYFLFEHVHDDDVKFTGKIHENIDPSEN